MSISRKPDDFKLLVSDQCRNNITAGRESKVAYESFLHVTRSAHGLHLLYETTRGEHLKDNALLSTIKSLLSCSKSRADRYQALLENQALPPKPVITRWETFVLTALHHHRNFNENETRVFASQIEARAADS
ncbi:uncharacterized protein LOC108863897 [Galendromus occidentalis]|uniref:Uncharacterized protein LOC108863897 n=1 Tax=Galendromus occidentalis TaxID=34638 RepID=A0AAJ7L3Y7_9ACAR|nr:uncharacterized protein LOC108863897 [Galendromus occidentalis]